MTRGRTTRSRPIAIDLFAGAGGMSLGFEQAGFDVAAAVELDPIHCAAHDFNFPLCHTICADIRHLSVSTIREVTRIGNQEVDVVFGGAPCQGFSMIGKRAFDDPRNQLVTHFVRVVSELNAKYFVFENVKGLTVGPHRQFLDELIAAFKRKGYNITLPYKVLNAADYGVPQDRRRLFLIGARKGLPTPGYPQAVCLPAGQRRSADKLPIGPSTWSAIGDLPEAEEYPELVVQDWVAARFGQATEFGEVLRGIAVDADDFSYRRTYNSRILTSSLRAEHTALSRKRFSETAFGETEPVSRFHKLDPDGVCNTLRAGTASDRGAFTSPRPIHPFTPRCITVREAARLHSYPDWFRFHVTKWHGFRQIGNSVPPRLARAVASQIMKALGARCSIPGQVLSLGDPVLLEYSMADAALRYGVPSNVIPKRTRRRDAMVENRAVA